MSDHHTPGHSGTDGHYIVCDVCGRGPSTRVFVRPRWVPKLRSERQTLAWARAAGRRIGLEIKAEIEQTGLMDMGSAERAP